VDVFAKVLLGPAPWEWQETSLILGADGVIWVILLILAIRGFVGATPSVRSVMLAVVLPALGLLASLVIISGNYGTMQRLRVQPEFLLLPLVVAGLRIPLREPSVRGLVEPGSNLPENRDRFLFNRRTTTLQ
jgi:hypothetical protein